MEDLTRTRPDVSATQPLPSDGAPTRRIHTTVGPRRQSDPRSIRLLRTLTFGLAIMVGLATLVVLQTRDDVALRNASSLYSPSGHLPGEPSEETRVSMAWSAVEGAAGYWWGVVATRSDLPQPVIRPSGEDRRVSFPFSGRGYFALRSAYRVDGELRWSDALLYGPIVVREPGDDAVTSPTPSVSPGTASSAGGAATSERRSGTSGSGGAGSGSSAAQPTPVDPRYAGQRGTCGTDGGSCGGDGQPGQPPVAPGGGRQSNCTNCPGTKGEPGPDGPPG